MADVMADRREAPRYVLILAAEVVEIASGATLNARSSDVSRTGCYIDTLNPVPLGSQVKVQLRSGDAAFEAAARVAYVCPGLGMGLHWGFNVAPERMALLDRWLAEAARISCPVFQMWLAAKFFLRLGSNEELPTNTMLIAGTFRCAEASTPDTRVLLFTAAIALLTGLLCGAAPATSASNTTPASALLPVSKIRQTNQRLFGKGLVASQVALSLVLVPWRQCLLVICRSLEQSRIRRQQSAARHTRFRAKWL